MRSGAFGSSSPEEGDAPVWTPSRPERSPGLPEEGTGYEDRATRAAGPSEDGSAAPQPRRAESGPRGERKRGQGPLGFLRELPVLLLIAFLLALLIKTFLVQAFYIPSESMLPTLEIGDRVLVNKVVYRLHPPERGDVIVFEEPSAGPGPERGAVEAFLNWLVEGLGVSAHPERDFIKRVVGLPGEVVELHLDEDNRCRVFVDGRALEERYLDGFEPVRCQFPATTVPGGQLFVMGDNRDNSNDSRFGLGTIPYDKVVGEAFVVIWPPSRMDLLRGS